MADTVTQDSHVEFKLKTSGESNSSQITTLIPKGEHEFEGLFSVPVLYKLIDEFFEEKGYDKLELKNVEIVRDDGDRYIELLLNPSKAITDYAKVIMKLKIYMKNVKDVEVKRQGLKIQANHGNLLFVSSLALETDQEGRWNKTPLFVAIRIFFDRFFFKHYTAQYEKEAKEDYQQFIYQIKSYLNMNKL